MRRSGLADSPLFSLPQSKRGVSPLSYKPPAKKRRGKDQDLTGKPPVAKRSSDRGTMTPRDHETMLPGYYDTIIELVRKAVKEFGKEAATHRFSTAEKKAIADIIYSYKNRGIRTSENEVTRIAVNFIVSDYRENGDNSVLDRALRALNG